MKPAAKTIKIQYFKEAYLLATTDERREAILKRVTKNGWRRKFFLNYVAKQMEE